jgi:lipopolysaccharide biosynthesis glycosyltransferase
MPENIKNIIFCIDSKYVNLTEFIFKTFKKYHNIKEYVFYFILYSPDNDNLHKDIISIINKISKKFIIKYKYFIPSDEFKNIINQYTITMWHDKKKREKKLKKVVFFNYANWSRFYINELFPEIKKGLYLDYDILFCNNIDKLFETNIDNHIVAVSPYNDKNYKCIDKRIKEHEENNLKNIPQIEDLKDKVINQNRLLYKNIKARHLDKINIFMKSINIDTEYYKKNYHYNCGVMFFNFELFEKNNILSKVIKFLEHMNETEKYFNSGTEKFQNMLIPNYQVLSVHYNNILKYRVFNLKKNKILHFKSFENLNKLPLYKNIFGRIMKK